MSDDSVVHVAPGTRLSGTIRPPGAKSGTVRALVCGTLAAGTTTIVNAGSGENVRAMATACRQIGARITEGDDRTWQVRGIDHRLPDELELDAGNSGIVLRVLAALGAATSHCSVGTGHPDSLGGRGNHELVDALRQLGAEATGHGPQACPPLVVGHGAGLRSGSVSVSCRRSSQFLTGLLFLAPLVGDDVEIRVSDTLKSPVMVAATVDAMARAGVHVEVSADWRIYRIGGGQRYASATHRVAMDGSSLAGALAAAAAVPGSIVTLAGNTGDDPGAHATIEALRKMGVRIDVGGSALVCHGVDEPAPVEMDGSLCPDSILPMAALACFARGTSVFDNVETLRFKECDRISDFCRELSAAGADVEERRDAIIVHGSGSLPGGGEVFGHHDHSVVMAMAAVALRSERGLTIRGWKAVGQTYPAFFGDLRGLGGHAAVTG